MHEKEKKPDMWKGEAIIYMFILYSTYMKTMLLSNAVNRRKTNTLYFRSEKLPVLFSDMSPNLVSGTKNLEESNEAQGVKGKHSVHTACGGRSLVDERGA